MILLDILSSIIDLLLLLVYLNNNLKTRNKNVPTILFYASFVATECILIINQFSFYSFTKHFSIPTTMLLSLFSTFALCFLYKTTLYRKIICTVIFQLFVMLSEYTFTILIQITSPGILNQLTSALVTLVNFGSKMVLFLFILVFAIFSKRDKKSNFEYHMFSLVTPVISLIIFGIMPTRKFFIKEFTSYDVIIFPCIIILNITNYLILERIKYTHGLELKNSQLEQQLNFQQDKYLQLSAAYKNTRRVVHDTKKHHFAISKYIEEKRYDELKDYVNVSYKELENTYAVFNTGNLVIDAFLSNYKNLAKERSINFHVALNLEASRIPVKDYDLCIILGNLLDNSFNACEHIDASDRWIDIRIYIDDYDKFRIDCRNSVKHLPDNLKPTESLEHGFGTANIYRTVKKNLGTTATELTSDTYTTAILIPIIDTKQRLHPPKKY